MGETQMPKSAWLGDEFLKMKTEALLIINGSMRLEDLKLLLGVPLEDRSLAVRLRRLGFRIKKTSKGIRVQLR